MNFVVPEKNGFTIYKKENCSFCEKLEQLLMHNKENIVYVPCDGYLVNQNTRLAFLQFIEKQIGKSYVTFPMVFYNGIFIGGYTEMKKCMDRQNAFKTF